MENSLLRTFAAPVLHDPRSTEGLVASYVSGRTSVDCYMHWKTHLRLLSCDSGVGGMLGLLRPALCQVAIVAGLRVSWNARSSTVAGASDLLLHCRLRRLRQVRSPRARMARTLAARTGPGCTATPRSPRSSV